MNIKDLSGKIGREIARRQRRKELKNCNFSIISNSCIGGVISNSLKERFNSPTVNLIIDLDDYLVFCQHLYNYSMCPLEQPNETETKDYKTPYPIGILRGGRFNLPDIAVRFYTIGLLMKQKQNGKVVLKELIITTCFLLWKKDCMYRKA